MTSDIPKRPHIRTRLLANASTILIAFLLIVAGRVWSHPAACEEQMQDESGPGRREPVEGTRGLGIVAEVRARTSGSADLGVRPRGPRADLGVRPSFKLT